MKKLRITILTTVLLAGATVTPLPTRDTMPATTFASQGDCHWVNGIWICDP
jgi:hypothetical protein